MSRPLTAALMFATLALAGPALAQQPGVARPEMVLKETVTGMPRGENQKSTS
jgi:hypothetical protein